MRILMTSFHVIADQARDLADELVQEKSGVCGDDLREKEAELEKAKRALRALRARRDALARPYVQRRLEALEERSAQAAQRG